MQEPTHLPGGMIDSGAHLPHTVWSGVGFMYLGLSQFDQLTKPDIDPFEDEHEADESEIDRPDFTCPGDVEHFASFGGATRQDAANPTAAQHRADLQR